MHMPYMCHTLKLGSALQDIDEIVCLKKAQNPHLADPQGVDESQSFTTTVTFAVKQYSTWSKMISSSAT
jgi:hypothetical protein